MASGRNYDELCPIFDFKQGAGVIFPFRPPLTSALQYFNLDGTAGSTGPAAFFKAAGKIRLVSVQCIACSDDQGAKGAAASTEPILVLRRNSATSLASGSLLATITCDLSGGVGDLWTPGAGTTDTTLSDGDTLVMYLTTAAASATSANKDGGAIPVLWFAAVNSCCS